MSESVIIAENLSKKYRLSHQRPQRYVALRDVLTQRAKNLFNFSRKPTEPTDTSEEFWALKEINFEIKQGEVVGIIGRNGAGKSTLLKILSRITEPTKGRISLRGRLASLLEVGAGFHHELTGRENIYLNGSILGMGKSEIDGKFDEIVSFAEISKFLDTQVKHYSSGMYVRLAFAVAAHLDPEILIIDEVLAVGDAQFQRKCIGKMESVALQQGRTVLFVSHQTNTIAQLCSRVIQLEKGEIIRDSINVAEVIAAHSFGTDNKTPTLWTDSVGQYDNQWFRPKSFSACTGSGNLLSGPIRNNEPIWIEIAGIILHADPYLTIGYAIYTSTGELLYWSYQTDQSETNWPRLAEGKCRLRSLLPQRLLNQGTYRLEMLASLHFREWLLKPGLAPTISLTIEGGLSDSPIWHEPRPGLLAPTLKWEAMKG